MYITTGFEIHFQQPGQDLAPGHPEKQLSRAIWCIPGAIFANVYFCKFYHYIGWYLNLILQGLFEAGSTWEGGGTQSARGLFL